MPISVIKMYLYTKSQVCSYFDFYFLIVSKEIERCGLIFPFSCQEELHESLSDWYYKPVIIKVK